MAPQLRSIGQVLTIVKAEFPDISISKIRFLESEGLLSPERAPSGYRRYSQVDIDRLRYILRVQRDHYLPLKVIREHLDAMDAGQDPPELDAAASGAPSPLPATPPPAPVGADPQSKGARAPIKLSRRELLQASGLTEAALLELERHLLVVPKRGSNHFGREALTVCVAARKLALYGMDSRHLRAIRQAAEREAGMVEQAVAPFTRRHSAETSQAAAEVVQLILHTHAAMMHIMLDRG
ncbi:MAG TPA: MerR family transcriptional regulator [Propionibacteriaceae bacterium]|nr:MerR family transcriptional regulator [Propionibacteriaceae bacterium]